MFRDFLLLNVPQHRAVSQGGADTSGGPLLDRLVVPGEKGTREPSPGALGDCRSPLSCTCYSLITFQWLWRAVTLRLLDYFSLQGPLDTPPNAWEANSQPIPPLFLALFHPVPFPNARDSDPGHLCAASGQPSSFKVLPSLTSHHSPPVFSRPLPPHFLLFQAPLHTFPSSS